MKTIIYSMAFLLITGTYANAQNPPEAGTTQNTKNTGKKKKKQKKKTSKSKTPKVENKMD